MDLSRPILLFQVLGGVWLAFELVLALRRRADPRRDKNADAGTAWKVWLTIGLSLSATIVTLGLPVPRLPAPIEVRLWTGCTLLALGLIIRWRAVRTLGRMFTVNVAIREGHELVEDGLYRWLRHPSYTGVFVLLVGWGIGFGNWLSLALAVVGPTIVLVHRIKVEERALAEAFPDRYPAYAARTSRVIPWVY